MKAAGSEGDRRPCVADIASNRSTRSSAAGPPSTWRISSGCVFRPGQAGALECWGGVVPVDCRCALTSTSAVWESIQFFVRCFFKIVDFCCPEACGRFLAPKSGPISGQGCQPGDFRLAVGGGVCGGEGVTENWTAISGSFFEKSEVAG